MIHNQWLQQAEMEAEKELRSANRALFQKQMIERYRRHKMMKLADNSCTKGDCPSCIKLRLKFQEAETFNRNPPSYRYEALKEPRPDEVSD